MIFNQDQTVLSAAKGYLSLGFSVIPLLGNRDAQRGKAPALKSWRPYQTALPSTGDLENWFGDDGYEALGLVLGRVSGLVVVDIDDRNRGVDFALDFSELINTYTVRSGNRQLPHYYFRLPDGVTCPTVVGRGVELRGDGSYVVAPPTTINGKRWRVAKPLEIKTLTEADLSRLIDFVKGSVPEAPKNRSAGLLDAFTPVSCSGAAPSLDGESTNGDTTRLEAPVLLAYFQRLVPELGRNNALFRAACFARDFGWSRKMVEDALVQPHVDAKPSTPHRSESPGQRRREAFRTIRSAFSRPARRRVDGGRERQQLPNAVREALMAQNLDEVARVLDGLWTLGVRAGDAFTARFAEAVLRGIGVGRTTIHATLKWLAETGVLGFSPLHPPLPEDADAASGSQSGRKQCLCCTVEKSSKNRGRPPRHFLMPSIEALCDWLGVKPSASDAVPLEDFASVKAYRKSLYVALIVRRPGQYSRAWLANRLGISRDTCRTYEREAGVAVTPNFVATPVYWRTLDSVVPPDDVPNDGLCLQDETGKRYPALRVIAVKLLAAGRKLNLLRQTFNHYFVPPSAEEQVEIVARYRAQMDAQAPPQPPQTYGHLNIPPQTAVTIEAEMPLERATTPVERRESVRVDAGLSSWQTQDYSDLEPTLEELLTSSYLDKPKAETHIVDELYDALREVNPAKSLSRKNAAGLVSDYGEARVRWALGRLREHRDVRNPAGFVVGLLRSKYPNVVTNRATSVAKKPPPAKPEKSFIERLLEDPYLDYLANADDFRT